MATVIFISSIILVFNTCFTTLLIYYILMNSFGTIIESESCSIVYATIKPNRLVKYIKEHIMTYKYIYVYWTINKLCISVYFI